MNLLINRYYLSFYNFHSNINKYLLYLYDIWTYVMGYFFLYIYTLIIEIIKLIIKKEYGCFIEV